jgi:hypothetical protein
VHVPSTVREPDHSTVLPLERHKIAQPNRRRVDALKMLRKQIKRLKIPRAHDFTGLATDTRITKRLKYKKYNT